MKNRSENSTFFWSIAAEFLMHNIMKHSLTLLFMKFKSIIIKGILHAF